LKVFEKSLNFVVSVCYEPWCNGWAVFRPEIHVLSFEKNSLIKHA